MPYTQIIKITLAAGLYGAALAWSAPAPWYWWVSRVDGHQVCAQSMPAQGWVRGGTPFNHAACQAPADSQRHLGAVPRG